MNGNAIKPSCRNKNRAIHGIKSSAITLSALFLILCASAAAAGEFLQQSSVSGPAPGCAQEGTPNAPTCGIEMTCTDRPVQLGYSDSVCFRATCPGIWALIHRRVDQVSFRRRFITYRHHSFRGTWELKDSGVVESGVAPLRELFLVLPDDLVELKLRDPDSNSVVEVSNLGYIKRGGISELKKWLAYNVYLERPERIEAGARSQNGYPSSRPCPTASEGLAGAILSGIFSVGRCIGLPFCP